MGPVQKNQSTSGRAPDPPLPGLDRRHGAPAGLGTGGGLRLGQRFVHVSQRKTKIPTCPEEGWLSDGRRVLHFKPVIWDRWQQELEVTHGEWLADQETPLLKRRQRLSREQAVELWRQRRAEGWASCTPQWQPPQPPRMVFQR